MEIVLLGCLAVLLIFLIIGLKWLSKRSSKKKNDGPVRAPQGTGVRRAAGVRGVRQRNVRGRAAEPEPQDQEVDDDAGDDENNEAAELAKMGAKKRAKMEAKAERKAQREIEERDREQRKKREQKEQEERDRQSAKEREEEKRREEAEKAAQEEKERREHEEYLKLKEAFSVEEEGFDEMTEGEEENLLKNFVEHIIRNKVVVLEDLARHFNLKPTAAIERVQRMQADNILSGVIDDRGKFIYISKKEFEAVASFVNRRGRVSLQELAEHSNKLIDLNPEKSVGAVA